MGICFLVFSRFQRQLKFLGLWPFPSVFKQWLFGSLWHHIILTFSSASFLPHSKKIFGFNQIILENLSYLKFDCLATLIPDSTLMMLSYVMSQIHSFHSLRHAYPWRGYCSAYHDWKILFTVLVNFPPIHFFFFPVILRRSKRSCVDVLYKLWSIY